MTRKRFVKLLMAYGLSRNMANSFAADVAKNKTAYGMYYELLTNEQARFDFAAAIQKIADEAIKVAIAVADAVSAFGKASCSLSFDDWRYSNGQSQNAGP